MSGLREGGDWGWGSTYCCRRRASVRSLRVVCRVRPVRVHGHAILGWTPSCSRRGSRRRRRVGREGGRQWAYVIPAYKRSGASSFSPSALCSVSLSLSYRNVVLYRPAAHPARLARRFPSDQSLLPHPPRNHPRNQARAHIRPRPRQTDPQRARGRASLSCLTTLLAWSSPS